MSNNKNILYLSGLHDPRFSRTGGEQRSQLLWKALQKHGNVYVIVLSWGEWDNIGDIRVKNVDICNVNPTNAVKNSFLKKVIRRINQKCVRMCDVSFFTLKDLLDLNTLFPTVKFDVVVCRYISTLNFLNPFKLNIPVYIDVDDNPVSVFDTLRRQQLGLNHFSALIWRGILQIELFYLSFKWQGIWVSNSTDLGRVGIKKKEVLLENIPFNVTPIGRSEANVNVLITVATLNHPPNQYGINSFLEEIWPKVITKYPNLEYWIIGRGKPLPEWGKNRNVKIFCNVPDLSEFYRKCLAAVVPIYTGAGTCIKTLEALAFGRVCLSTPFGARGFEKKEPCDALKIYNNSEQFLDKLSVIIDRADKRHTLENIAEQYMNKNNSIKSFNESVSKLIES